jgi:hypothetical protein
MFKAISIKIPMTFFIEIEKSIIKSIWKHKRPVIVKAILSKKSNAGGITIPDFSLYYRVITVKYSIALAQKRLEDKWNRRTDPDLNPHSYSHLIFDKGPKNIG